MVWTKTICFWEVGLVGLVGSARSEFGSDSGVEDEGDLRGETILGLLTQGRGWSSPPPGLLERGSKFSSMV